jgi:TPR repeat protein
LILFAQIYIKGDSMEKNILEAIYLYQMVIELNNSYAMIHLVQIYEKGYEIKKKYFISN